MGIGSEAGLYFGGVTVSGASYSTFIGYHAYPQADNQVYQNVIGSGAIGNGSYTVTIGSSNNNYTYLYGTISNAGDQQFTYASNRTISVAQSPSGGGGNLTITSGNGAISYAPGNLYLYAGTGGGVGNAYVYIGSSIGNNNSTGNKIQGQTDISCSVANSGLYNILSIGTISTIYSFSSNGSLLIGTTSNNLSGVIQTAGNIVPATASLYNLGSSTYLWNNVYAVNGTIQTSDRNAKDNIFPLNNSLDFINYLNPVNYTWKGDTKIHSGLIAQDVESIDPNFGGLYKEGDKYGLNYSEFIAPLIKSVQELTQMVKDLKNEIEILKS